MKNEILKYYDKNGYTLTINHITELNSSGKISLKERSELEALITHLELQPKRNKIRSKK